MSWRDVLWLTLGFGFFFGFQLGDRPLANPDESRYAEIPREMIAHGDWVTPRLNEVPYFEKPPLVYWTVALSQKIFGPSEWSVRLTPGLFSLAGVLLTYATAARWRGRNTGLAAAIILGSSLIYFALSQILLLDMAVSVLISATLFCFIFALEETPGPRRRWLFYGLYASAALATLAKGLIGFLLPGAVMFFWLLIFDQWKRLRPLYLPSGILLFLAIAAPWHVLAAQRNPGWAHFYFVHEHWERFTTTEHARVQPWWFFAPVLLLGFFPWTGFLWSALRELLAGGWRDRRANAGPWFFGVWAAFIFLFFSKSQSKLIPYLLPVFPPLAVLMGEWFARHAAEIGRSRLRLGLGIFSGFCGVLGIVLLAMVLKPGMIHDPEQAVALRPYGCTMAAILLVGGVVVPAIAARRDVRASFAAVAAAIGAFYVVFGIAGDEIQRPGTKSLALVARERVRSGDHVYHFQAFFHDFVYYTARPVGLVDYTDELEVQFLSAEERAARFINSTTLRRQWGGAPRVWVVMRKTALGEFQQHVSADYHLIAENARHYLLSNQP